MRRFELELNKINICSNDTYAPHMFSSSWGKTEKTKNNFINTRLKFPIQIE